MSGLISELIIASVGLAITMVSSTAALAYWLGRRLTRLEAEVSRLDSRITSEAGKLDSRITSEVNRLDSRVTFEANRLDSRITSEVSRLDSRITSEAGKLGSAIGSVKASVSRLGEALVESNGIILDYLGLKGLLTAEEAGFVVKRIQGLVSLAAADPKKEELDFVMRVISKGLDEVTLEEVNRAYEVALRWWTEESHRLGILVPMGLSFLRAYVLSRDRAKPK